MSAWSLELVALRHTGQTHMMDVFHIVEGIPGDIQSSTHLRKGLRRAARARARTRTRARCGRRAGSGLGGSLDHVNGVSGLCR